MGRQMMKRIIIILSALFALISCAKESGVQLSEDGVRLSIGLSFPPMPTVSTKTLGENEDISSLRIAVFDDAGVLREQVVAYPQKRQDGSYTFDTSLRPLTGPVHLHFIANDPGDLPSGLEEEVMSSVKAQNGTVAYWQRVVLNGGIISDSYEMYSSLAQVSMIRNFSKLTIESTAANFTLYGYAVVNTPTACHTALYVGENFVSDYVGATYDYLKSKYVSSAWEDLGIDRTIPTSGNSTYSSTASRYLYPRAVMDASCPTFLIVYGKYGSNPATYYKVNLLDPDDRKYMPIFRNFEYKVTITNVTDTGESTPEDAAQIVAPGDYMDINVATTYETNASDAIGKLTLGYTLRTFSTGGTYTIPVEFLTDKNNASSQDNSLVQIEGTIGDVINSASISGAKGALTMDVKSHADKDFHSQTLTLRAGNIAQKVYLYYCSDLAILATCTQNVKPALKQDVLLRVGLPSDMPEALFPIVFTIDVAQNTISPDETRSPGLTTAVSGNKYVFRKKLTWSEYQQFSVQSDGPLNARKVMPIYFLTTQLASASSITVSSDLTSSATCSFTNEDANRFTNLEFVDYANLVPDTGRAVSFKFTASAPATVTISLEGTESNDGRLNYQRQNSLKRFYTFQCSAGENTLSLKTNADFTYIRAILNAEGFTEARKAIRVGDFTKSTAKKNVIRLDNNVFSNGATSLTTSCVNGGNLSISIANTPSEEKWLVWFHYDYRYVYNMAPKGYVDITTPWPIYYVHTHMWHNCGLMYQETINKKGSMVEFSELFSVLNNLLDQGTDHVVCKFWTAQNTAYRVRFEPELKVGVHNWIDSVEIYYVPHYIIAAV